MPFSARVIDPREDIPEVFQGNAVKVLEKANVSNMIGLLEQLNSVSKFASEVFADILKDTEKNSMRIKDCKSRISRIDSKVAPIEKMFVERAPSYFYDNPYPGKEWKRRDALKGLIFRRDRSSMEVNRRRNEADPPPNLSALDNYSNQPCIKKFTDSNFFMNEWMEAEKKKIEEEKAKRIARKKRKKKKRDQKKTIKKIKVKKFDPVTGKMIEVQEEDVVVKQYTLTGDVQETNIDYEDRKEAPRGPPKPGPAVRGGAQRGRGGQPRGRGAVRGAARGRGRGRGRGGPPINPVAAGGGPPPNPVARGAPPPNPVAQKGPPAFNPSGGPPAFNPVNRGPPAFNPGGGPPPNPMAMGANNSKQNAAAPPPNPYAMESSPQPPKRLSPMERAMMSAQAAENAGMLNNNKPKPKLPGMKSNMLLSQIQAGKKLRKATQVKREIPKDKRSMLMSALRNGAKLKKTVKKKAAPKQEKKEENEGIFAILNRRQFLADDDSDDSDEDSGWDSD